MRRYFGQAAILAALLFLSGCLISEMPLLDASTGKATPIESGEYQACQIDEGGESDCQTMKISRDETALYRFEASGEEDDITFVRFKKLAVNAWAAQLSGEDDSSYFYFLAEAHGDEFIMALINCEDIPEAVRKRYVKNGQMEVDEDATACTAKTLRSVLASAKAYRKAAPIRSRSHIVYKRMPG